ncbi:MAG TPA: ExeM/NucH family extracellular endonuclease [Opitutaceae bacterium]|nr:ExeM/NucH family extracellular endonuclease [Opitutaceae bacterium]
MNAARLLVAFTVGFVSLCPAARAAAFTPGNLVVVRVGTGSAALSSSAAAVFLDEYTPAGALVQSVALPTAPSLPNRQFSLSGTATSEGALALSVDGRYLVLAGYDAAPGAGSVTTSSSASVNRVVARAAADGTVDTTTALTDFSTGSNPRSAASTDGTALWVAGGAGGARYATFGGTTSVQLSTTVVNLRVLGIFGGQLYTSSASGAFRLATIDGGLPTTSGQTTVNLPGFPTSGGSPYGYFFATLGAGPGPDTVYVADDSSGAGIQKYALVSGSWTLKGTITVANVRAVTGQVAGSTVTLYASGATTSVGTLYAYTDTSGYNAAPSGTLSTLALGAPNTVFRGLAFAPATSVVVVAPTITTQPATQTVNAGDTVHFTVAAGGTAPFTYQWRKGGVALSDGGSISGTTSDTLTLTGVTTGDGGSYDVVVSNSAGDATSDAAVLTVNPLAVAPSITTQPVSQTVTAGNTASFTVAAGGTPPFTYQWRFGGANLTDGSFVTGSATATLTLTGVTAAFAGSYDVVVSNGVNPPAVSNPATLTVNPAPPAVSTLQWNFGTTAGVATPTGLPADVTGGALTSGNNNGTTTLLTTTSASSGYTGASGQFNAGAADRIGALNQGANGSAYFEFTLTPDYNKQLTVTGLSFGSRSTGTGPQAFAVFTSLDGFTTPIVSGALANTSTWALQTPTIAPLTTDTGAEITFRIFGYNGAGSPASGTANWRIDDLAVTLTTAVGTPVPPAVTAVTPADGATGVAPGAPVTVTFNKAVDVSGTWFTLAGSASGAHTATVAGGPKSFTLTPDAPFALGETVTLTVLAAAVTDQATGTLHPAADFTSSFATLAPVPLAIHAVQGSGLTSPVVSQTVMVQGVVVASFQGADRIGGFYLEAPQAAWDDDPATSEGIYVFDNTDSVTVGDYVNVVGTVVEYGTAPHTETEISPVIGFLRVSAGNPLPPAVPVTLPFASATDAERYEGMLVTCPQTLTVSDNYDLGHYGELLVSNGRLLEPTNIVAPGAPAQAQEAANLLNQLVLDDGTSTTYPDPTPYLNSADPAVATRRAGSTVTGLTGILDDKFGVYVIEPTQAVALADANPRAAAPATGGTLRVAFGNVENFMNGDGTGGGFPTSRGALTYAEYLRQRAKVVAGILSLTPDLMGLSEVENDRITNGQPDSYGPVSAIADLVSALNAAAPPGTTYAFVNAAAVDIVTDDIHSAIIYRVQAVEPVGAPAMLDNVYFNLSARNPLAQTFREKASGAVFTLCVNHFRAKASASSLTDGISPNPNLDQGDGQGTNNYLRTKEAQAVVQWLATDPTGSGDPRVLIVGDLNSYAKEDPLAVLEGAGYVNLIEQSEGVGGYSYAFSGEVGHIDHVLASPALAAQAAGAATWHANSDEPVYYEYPVANKSAAQQAVNAGTPYRYSDHDPVVVGLNLTTPPAITVPPASQTATVGDTVTFGVTAAGTPAPAFQWRHNGAAIGGATGATLTLAHVTTADAGAYDVVVTNSVGTATSAAATLTVNKAAAGVTLGNLAATYDGSPHPVSVGTVPAGLAVTVTYDGGATAPTAAGHYAVAATVADANYFGGAADTLVIAQAGQTITFPNPGPHTFKDAPFALAASASSGLPVGYTVVGGPATVSGNVVTLTGAGNVTLAASQPGNGNFHAAPDVVVSFTVAKATATIALAGLDQVYDGTPRVVTATTDPAGLTVTVTYNGSATPPVNPGAYAVVATVNDPNYAASVSDTLVVTITALINHAPTLNGDIDGSAQVLLPENLTLNSAMVSGDLLVPGTPPVKLNGRPTYGSTVDGTGAAAPSNYTVTLNGNAVLRHVVRRTDPIAMPVVGAPSAPAGTRDVAVNKAGQAVGDFATLRNLTLNGNAGTVAVPPGTYGTFIANGGGGFVLGVAGATDAAVYNLQGLTLNGNAQLQVAGPVILTLAGGVTVNGTVGVSTHAEWLLLRIASGGLTLNGGVVFHGDVVAPAGTVIINGNSTLHGEVVADRLTVNGNGVLTEEFP